MKHTIRSNQHNATIDSCGAHLHSYHVHDIEYIWQRNPEIWGGSAPILFPFVGYVKGEGFTHQGKKYSMGKHGFVRQMAFTPVPLSESSVAFELRSSPETRVSYPFDFLLRVTFSLKENRLQVDYEVFNEGEDKMYFSLGSHPGFKIPFAGGVLEDYYIEFEKEETLDLYSLDNGGPLCDTPKAFFKNERKIALSKKIFEADALIFKNIVSNKISLRNTLNDSSLTLNTGGAPHLGIWAKPGAPYVCLEPWSKLDDRADAATEISEKEGMSCLEAGQASKMFYSISVQQD